MTTTEAPFELNGNLMLRNSFIDCATSFEDDGTDLFLMSDWAQTFTHGGNTTDNVVGSADLRDAFDPTSPNFRLGPASAASSGAVQPAGDFFDDVAYLGAVSPDTDWTDEWTTFESDACDDDAPPAHCSE